jgi:putative ABC transport system permease protein
MASFSSFARDARIGIRTLVRSPGFLVTAVLSLALALGAAAAAFAVIDAVRFRALPFKDGDRLVLLSEVPIDDGSGAVPASVCRADCDVAYETYADLIAVHRFQTMDAVAAYTSGGKALNKGGEPIVVQGGVATPGLFAMLGVTPELGRLITPDDDRLNVPLVVLISHDLWKDELGGEPGIIGQTIKLSDSHYVVVGVMPPGFHHEVGNRFWLPAVPTLDPSTRPSIRSITAIGRLAPGRSVEQLRAELATIEVPVPASAGPNAPRFRLDAMPLRDRYTTSTRAHDLILAAIVACILLIACANLANLVLVRALHQQREFGVRAALGARPLRLAGDLLVQHAFVVALAWVVGLLFASWFLEILRSLTVLDSIRPAGMEYRLDGPVVAFTALLAVVIGIVLSLLPGRMAARADVALVLREGAPSSGGGRLGNRMQQAFVVAQIASAVVLLVGAGLMTRTVLRLSELDLGFSPGSLLEGTPSYPHPWRVKETYLPVTRQILADLAELPGARSVALEAPVPLGPRGKEPEVTPTGSAGPLPPTLVPTVEFSVSPGFFATLGVTVLQGREFTPQDLEQTPPVAIVNQWAARRWWPGQDAVGRTFRVDTAPGRPAEITVVGVVHDHKGAQGSLLLADDGPEVYRPYEQASSPFPSFFVRAAGSPTGLVKPMRDLLVRSVPDRPVFASLVADRVAEQLGGVRVTTWQIVGFAVVGFLLALIGVHGVLAYAVGRRTREIGIRGALGASRGDLRRMVLRDAARLTAIGLGLGIVGARFATGLIRDLLHGTSPTDPLVFGAVALVVLVVSLVASAIPARRASRVDPMEALRTS